MAAFAANALVIDEESKLHLWIGYFVIALVAIRIVWGLIGTRYARFSSFRPSLSAAMEQISDIATGRRIHLGHTPLGALMIYNLIVTLLLIGLTGWLMTTDMFWGRGMARGAARNVRDLGRDFGGATHCRRDL
ncbi:cytochrome b/b6 domain-containing protein [Jhaorihella thermophila]